MFEGKNILEIRTLIESSGVEVNWPRKKKTAPFQSKALLFWKVRDNLDMVWKYC